jgi:hypothetical protein
LKRIHWNIGTLEHWNIGTLEQSNPWILAYTALLIVCLVDICDSSKLIVVN